MVILNDVLYDPRLSDNDVLAYTFLKVLTYSENYDSCLFTLGEVVDQIYGEINSHNITGQISKSLHKLMDTGYILTQKKKQGSWYIFMTSYNLNPEDRFTVVNPAYLRAIMDSKYRNKPSILRFYMMLMSTIYKGTKVGTYDQSWFADKMHVTTATISSYMTALEKLGIIFIYRAADFYTSNTYGSIDDEAFVRAEGEKRTSKRKAHENANEKRKYVAMFQNFLNGKEYPINTLKEIYEHMKNRNIEIKSLGDAARSKPYDLAPLIDKIKAEC